MMSEYERELFDEFKCLESLCRDMFSCQHGVSEYINQMEQTPAYIQNHISSWNEDYRTLKHLRWLRNQIAHETTATDCNLHDVEQLKNFYCRILNGQDPLAVSTKVKQKLQTTSSQWPTSKQIVIPSNIKKTSKPAHGFPRASFNVFLLLVLFVIFILYFLHANIL